MAAGVIAGCAFSAGERAAGVIAGRAFSAVGTGGIAVGGAGGCAFSGAGNGGTTTPGDFTGSACDATGTTRVSTGSTLGIETGELELRSGFTGGALLGLEAGVVLCALPGDGDLLTGTRDGEVA